MPLPLANILQPLIDFAHAILRFFHDQAGLSWGLSIIALTVVVRLLILPLTFKGVRGMQAMQQLAPEMKEIQERYKDDSQRKNQEMMKLYQDRKVNPLGSCLPILLQIPFFISIFYLLRNPEFRADIRGEESFLFIPNLAEPATGEPVVLAALIVLYVTTQLGASLVSMATADPTQRKLFLALPFVFVLFVINFETGLLVYWITTNIWTVGQQLFVKRFLPPPEPVSAKAAVESKGRRGKAAAGDGKPAGEPARGTKASADADGRPERAARARGRRGVDGDGDGRARKAPPPSPRKKKKSGRRR